MNNLIFNQFPTPLYVLDVDSNKFLSGNYKIYYIDTGVYFLDNNATLLIKINNPENSTKTLFLEQFTITSSVATLGVNIALYKNGSFSGSATTLTNSQNTNCASTASCKAEVTIGTSGATTDYLIFIDTVNTPQYTSFQNGSICIPSNSSLLFKIDEIANTDKNLIVSIFWAEI